MNVCVYIYIHKCIYLRVFSTVAESIPFSLCFPLTVTAFSLKVAGQPCKPPCGISANLCNCQTIFFRQLAISFRNQSCPPNQVWGQLPWTDFCERGKLQTSEDELAQEKKKTFKKKKRFEKKHKKCKIRNILVKGSSTK